MISEFPLVSVLMTSFNREKFIAESIESVLDQTYSNFELIIVDDCSKDSTLDIAYNYAKRDKRIRVYQNEFNLGDYKNRNIAATYAMGEYIMYVDSDDLIKKDSIDYVVKAFKEFPGVKHSAIYYQNDKIHPFILPSERAILSHFNGINILSGGPGSRVFDRTYFFELGGYPEKYGPASDMYFNLKSTLLNPILFLPCNYLFYRQHSDQENKNKKSYIINNYVYFNDIFSDFNMPFGESEIERLLNKNKKRFLLNVFYYFINTFNFYQAYLLFKKANFKVTDLWLAIRS